MKLWLDDLRPAPDKTWFHCKDVSCMVHNFLLYGLTLTEISLDHDLGPKEPTGYEFLCWLMKKVLYKEITKIPIIKVHSANPVARRNMEIYISTINLFLEEENEDK